MNSTNNREAFLKTLEYFNENYNVVTGAGKNIKWYKSVDEYYKGRTFEDIPYGKVYSHVNIEKVKRATINHDDNCFKPFYTKEAKLKEFKEYNGRWLYVLFEVLSDTEIGLLYVDDYAEEYRDRKKQNRNQALRNKIDDILDYAESVHLQEATIKELIGLQNSLENKHLTKVKVFKNLLYWVGALLNDGKNSLIVANTTNAIIKDYFGIDDIHFKRDAKIENYTEITYTYSDAKGLKIHHS